MSHHPSDKRHFRGSVERSRDLRRESTDPERRLWSALRVLKQNWRRQVPIGPYIADFAQHGARLIIELDGGQHAEPDAEAYDERRTAFLNSQGYRVLRFWNVQVMQELDGVMDAILEELGGAPLPRPDRQPSPYSAHRRTLAPPPSHGADAPRAPPSPIEGEGR